MAEVRGSQLTQRENWRQIKTNVWLMTCREKMTQAGQRAYWADRGISSSDAPGFVSLASSEDSWPKDTRATTLLSHRSEDLDLGLQSEVSVVGGCQGELTRNGGSRGLILITRVGSHGLQCFSGHDISVPNRLGWGWKNENKSRAWDKRYLLLKPHVWYESNQQLTFERLNFLFFSLYRLMTLGSVISFSRHSE